MNEKKIRTRIGNLKFSDPIKGVLSDNLGLNLRWKDADEKFMVVDTEGVMGSLVPSVKDKMMVFTDFNCRIITLVYL